MFNKENKKTEKHKDKKLDDSQKEVVLDRDEFDALTKKAEDKDELWDRYLRLYSEFENSKKLWARQKEELLKFGNFRLLRDFVSALDEINAALAIIKDNDEEHAKGLKMVYKNIQDVLVKEGVQPIETEGKIFDPHLHEALLFEENSSLPEHSIIEVLQPGYKYGEKVLRPAKVKVSVKTKPADSEERIAESENTEKTKPADSEERIVDSEDTEKEIKD